MFARFTLLALAVSLAAAAITLADDDAPSNAGDRPNILWISCEDTSPDLGCYGVGYARTPTLDKLADQGVRFTRAFSHAGVCAPARSGVITGMYPTTIGTNNMRCSTAPPAIVKCFPEYLRAAGYFTTNRSKTDYQFDPPPSAWDAQGDKHDDWAGRPDKVTPFFSVINLTVTHESQVWPRGDGKTKHDPAKAPLPPYYPDTPVVRRDIAQYFDNIATMDAQVRAILDRLEKDGLADDTIVVFWSDHGAGLTRAKRWLYDSGTRVPMIVRVPAKWRERAGLGEPGTTHDGLVAFVDFAPTMLSLAGVEIPEHLQGVAWAGPAKGSPREYVFGARDRMDERYDTIRMCRDKRWLYIRNFQPWLSRGQHLDYMDRMPMLKEIRRLHAAGELEYPQNQFVLPDKPVEELYDTEADPHNVRNLADDPAHRETLLRMRARLEAWRRETGDVGLVPEPIFERMKRPSPAAPPVFVEAAGGAIAIDAPMACPSIEYRLGGGRWAMYTGPVNPGEAKLEARVNGINRGVKTAAFDPRRDKPLDKTPTPVEEADHWRRALNNSTILDELAALHAVDLRDPAAAYRAALEHKHPAMRYWGVRLLHKKLGDRAAMDAIAARIADADPAVRIAAAEALADWGHTDQGLAVLVEQLDTGKAYDVVFAANALDDLGEKARPVLPQIKRAKLGNYGARVIEKAIADLETR